MKSVGKKLSSRLLLFMLVCSIAVLARAVTVQAEETTVEVTKAAIRDQGVRNAIQEALDEAWSNATEKDPYVVKIPEGTYTLDNALYVFSNTTLDLTGVTIKRKKDTKNQINVIRLGYPEDSPKSGAKGYYYKNIHIKNGTFDGGGGIGTIVKLVHAQNCSITGTEFKNILNAHMIELAAADGITITGCTFKDQTINTTVKNEIETVGMEAIQMDIMASEHIAGCRSEALSVSNITVDKCTFSNMARGIGSHTSIINVPYTGIRITNCTFTDMKSSAIQGVAWQDALVQGNRISKTPKGIEIYTIREEGRCAYVPSYLAKQGKTTTTASDKFPKLVNCKLVIADNKISLNSKKDPYVDTIRAAIRIGGKKITKKKKFSDNSGQIPVGNYYMKGAVVSGNTITTTGYGIRIENGRNCKVADNTVNCKTVKSDKSSYQGIWILESSKKAVITGNTVSNAKFNAIQVTDKSSASEISSNTLTAAGKYGINIAESGVSVDKISKNKISKSKNHGIFIYNKATAGTISKNTVTSPGGNGIAVNTNATAKTISGNTVKKSKDIGIAAGLSSKVSNIKDNTIDTCKTNGIKVYGKSNGGNITGNKIKNPGPFGVCVSSGSKAKTVSKNKVTKAKTKDIQVDSTSSVANMK